MKSRSTLAVPKLCGLIHQLIKSRVDIVSELDLGDRSGTLGGTTNGKTHDALFAEGGVENAIRTVVNSEIHGAAEDATKGYIFSEDEDVLVMGQSELQGIVDGLKEVHAFCC